MLSEDGAISFCTEIIEAIDRCLADYRGRVGGFGSDLERGLVISYLLGTMRCELEVLWDCVGQSAAFGGLHPRAVFEDCIGGGDEEAKHRCDEAMATLLAELRRRGWVEPAAPTGDPSS